MPQLAFGPLGVSLLFFIFPQEVFSFQLLHQFVVSKLELASFFFPNQPQQAVFFFPYQPQVVATQPQKAAFSFQRQPLPAVNSFQQSSLQAALFLKNLHQEVAAQL